MTVNHKLKHKKGSMFTRLLIFPQCPPCRAFTPQLGKTYSAIKAANKGFEVIFFSSDRSEESFNNYLGEMPWYAVPYDDASRRNGISKHFGVEGIERYI